MGMEWKFGGREYSDGKRFGHFFNDSSRPPLMENLKDSPIINKYSCFITIYFSFYYA